MKIQNYLAVIIRLFAIALAVFALRFIEPILMMLFSSSPIDMRPSTMIMLVSVFMPFMIALVLWFFPMSVANKIVREDMRGEMNAVGSVEMLMVLLIGLAFYFLFGGIVDLIYWFSYSSIADSLGEISSVDIKAKATLLSMGAQMLIAMLLLFKSKSISVFILNVAR